MKWLLITFITAVLNDASKWKKLTRPWFRGESGTEQPLCPNIAKYNEAQENHLVQSFRRKAGGLANTPSRGETDKWLFLAQHYGIPTRLLDWTEGVLLALYFALNQEKDNPRVYMLNPHRLNELAGVKTDYLNFPLTWDNKPGYKNIALAWERRAKKRGFDLPIAVPAIYQDYRMIAQRSCFTVHGKILEPIPEILKKKNIDIAECLVEYDIDPTMAQTILKELAVLGVSASTIYPDLDHLAKDIYSEVKIANKSMEATK